MWGKRYERGYPDLAPYLTPEDLLVPGRRTTYEKILEETYTVIISLEKALNHLANELEYQQARLEEPISDVQGLH